MFGTDYPQEIRGADVVRNFVDGIAALGADGKAVLRDNARLLMKGRA